MKVGDLVKRKTWDDIEYNPHKAQNNLGIIVSYEKDREIPGGADIDVAFPDGIHREYSHHLEVISESR
jgi:hypothetical protein